MPGILVDAEKMNETAEVFSGASDRLLGISKDLDEAIQNLQGNWEGISKQQFYKQFIDLKSYLDSFADLSSKISRQMHQMADEVNKIDEENFDLK